MGQAGNAAVPARGPALRERLSLWRHLSGAGRGRRAGAALRRHRRHAAASRRDTLHVARDAHAVLLLDRAGWHTTGNLVWPRNITPILLPSRSPELNPVEQVWQYLRANFLSNRVFEAYDDIVAAACDAWNRLIAKPPPSHQSECANGPIRVSYEGRWYYPYVKPLGEGTLAEFIRAAERARLTPQAWEGGAGG